MRSDTATTRRVRLVIVLAVAAAVTVMFGVILVAASVVMRLLTSNDPVNMVRLGLDAVAAGVAFGLVVLVVFAIARIGAAGRSRPSASTADHRRGAGGPQPTAASPGRGESARPGPSQGHGQDRLRAGAPGTGGGHGGARSGRPPVLNPTNVYTPGGLLDVPRDGRAPGTPGGQFIPEILRTAGPPPAPGAPAPGASAPGPPAGGRNQDWPSPGWAGVKPPRPGYQPGMNPGGPGRAPYAPGGQPPPPMPPRDYMRPREAPRPGHAMPPREAPRPGHVGPPRDAGLPREGMPREAVGPGGPIRPGGPVPPRDPAYQPPPGQGPHQHQGGGAGRHAGGAGYAAPGGRRPGFQGHPGPAGPAEAPDQFDGGYAYVIRPSDNPVRSASPVRPPSFDRPADQPRPVDPARSSESVRPADPARSSESDVYVYRDTGDQPDDPAPAAPGPDEHDASYWYDLPGTSAGGDTTACVPQETRGPFEPLVSSADPPGTTPRISASLDDAEPVVPESPYSQEAPPAAADDGFQDTAHDHARKLEQIKNLYLTAEAIGEANVDKHFDHLQAQQRELISEYFKQSSATRPAVGAADQAGAEPASVAGQEPGDPGEAAPAGGPAGAAESARVTADHPGAW